MAVKGNRFENGAANGASVSIANSDDTGASAFSVVSPATSGTIVYDSTAFHGSQSGLFTNATTNSPVIVALADTAATSFACRVYVRITGLPDTTGVFGIRTQTSAAGQGVKCFINTSGNLIFVTQAGQVGPTSTAALALNTWYRWEFQASGLNSAATALSAAIYLGDNATPVTGGSITVSGLTTTTDCAEIRYGRQSATSMAAFYLDDIEQNIGTATAIGPSVDPFTSVDTFTLSEGSTDVVHDDQLPEATLAETGSLLTTVPATTPSIPWKAGQHRVRIDWAREGFGFTTDDVTDNVRGVFSCSYGRESAISGMVAGRGQLDLDNTDRLYSPRNIASPIYPNVKPARPVLWERTLPNGSTYTVFRARTDDQPINPDPNERRVQVSLVDSLADFRGTPITTEVYQGIWSGTAVNLVLDAYGWTGARQIDQGATLIHWWWENGTDAFDALQKIVVSEGAPAMLTIDADGAVVFRGRHHRLTSARSTTSQQTWRGDDGAPEPVMAPGFSYDDAWRNVVNRVTIEVPERTARARSELWSTDESIVLDPFEARTFVVSTSDPFIAAVPPVEGVDYEVMGGRIEPAALTRTSGASTSITLTAGSAGGMVQGLKLRGQPVQVVRTFTITETPDDNGQSLNDYGTRDLPAGSEPVWAGRLDARSIARLAVEERAQPLTLLTVRFVCGTGDDARLAKLLAVDLSDRITVVEPESAATGDYFVESISHEIHSLAQHVITFGLEAAPPARPAPFILGTSELDTGILAL